MSSSDKIEDAIKAEMLEGLSTIGARISRGEILAYTIIAATTTNHPQVLNAGDFVRGGVQMLAGQALNMNDLCHVFSFTPNLPEPTTTVQQ